MRVGVPGEFHEDRWQRTAEDSERCMLPRTREVGGTHRIQVIAWRRGASDRSSARLPCPQVPQCHPRVAKGASGRSSARLPCPQAPQCHLGVAKGASGRSLARGPCAQVLQRHSGVAKQSSIGSSSIKCRCFMDVEVRIAFLSMKCRCFMDVEVRIGCLSIKCRCFMDVALTCPPGFSGDYFIPRISIPTS